MKKTDIAMIVFIISISVLGSYFIVGAIPGLKASDEPVSVKTIESYSPDIEEVDKEVFNKDAINPTVEVTIGNKD